jgi:hypothetical protein
MEIPKGQIVELLRERGRTDQASQADQELPDNVDPERDSGLLDRFGLDQQDLVRALGDRLPSGLGDKLGGL